MRISHIEVASAAAERLKKLLPALGAIPGSVQAELFIIYSSLKYLSLELARMSAGSAEKQQAAGGLRAAIEERLAAGHFAVEPPVNGSQLLQGGFAPRDNGLVGDKDRTVFVVVESFQSLTDEGVHLKILWPGDVALFSIDGSVAVDENGSLAVAVAGPFHHSPRQGGNGLV